MTSRWARLLVAVPCAVAASALVAVAWLDHLERSIGRPDLGHFATSDLVIVVGLTVSMVVGAVVALERPHHPVGWLFLALGLEMMLAGLIDEVVQYGTATRPPPGAALRFAAVVGNSTWMPWFLLVALVLLLTPTGRPLSPRWGIVVRVEVVAGTVTFLQALVSDRALDPPYADVSNPLAIPAIEPAADWVGYICLYVMAAGLVAGGVSLLVRFRRSRGEERRQLLWLAFIVVPLPLFVVLAFVTSMHHWEVGQTLTTGGFVTLIPIAAGLSVLRYRLYDVDRVLSATATYALLTACLVGTYVAVVWGGAHAGAGRGPSPELSATIGAVVATAVAAPLRRLIQTGLDRRFSRRAYDARRVVRAGLAQEDAGIDLVALFVRAFDDQSVTVAYPAEAGWVDQDGSAAGDREDAVDVRRHGRVVARVGFDPRRIDPTVALRTAQLASTELDNARLRAELGRRLEEIDASRRRLATAQRTERRRIERDLHDGAQQSLLALAFDLRSAEVNGDAERMRAALADGAESARTAVRQLRSLANGLHPAALEDGGLSAALDDLARHSPVPVRLDVGVGRLDPTLEFTAWTVVGEAVVNAQKHAAASAVAVAVTRHNGHLRLRIADDGRGGANPDGPGLRGLRDRVEAASGRLILTSGPAGTTLEAMIPCGS